MNLLRPKPRDIHTNAPINTPNTAGVLRLLAKTTIYPIQQPAGWHLNLTLSLTNTLHLFHNTLSFKNSLVRTFKINGAGAKHGSEEKDRLAFSVPPVAEVKILWTEPRSFFPRSQLKVFCIYCPLKNDHWPPFSPSAAGESDAESGDRCYSPPDGIASKHPRAGQPHAHEISNQVQIHEVCLVWMEIAIDQYIEFLERGWKLSPSRQVLRWKKMDAWENN